MLKTEPDNAEALTGKKLIARAKRISRRRDKLENRTLKDDIDKKHPARRLILWTFLILALLCVGIAVAFISGAIPAEYNPFI